MSKKWVRYHDSKIKIFCKEISQPNIWEVTEKNETSEEIKALEWQQATDVSSLSRSCSNSGVWQAEPKVPFIYKIINRVWLWERWVLKKATGKTSPIYGKENRYFEEYLGLTAKMGAGELEEKWRASAEFKSSLLN